jgi:hypothetical protein
MAIKPYPPTVYVFDITNCDIKARRAMENGHGQESETPPFGGVGPGMLSLGWLNNIIVICGYVSTGARKNAKNIRKNGRFIPSFLI